MEKNSIFRQESLDRIASPEKLDDYIKVSKTSGWMLIAALFLVTVGVAVWGVTGTLPQTMEAKGVVEEDGAISCYIPVNEMPQELEGCRVEITPARAGAAAVKGKIAQVSQFPYSVEEASAMILSDWMTENLIQADYVYRIVIKPDTASGLQENTMADVVIVTSEVRPISYILN